MSNPSATSPEQRQHINISQYAYDVIISDSQTFLGKTNISGFINRIVLNLGEDFFNTIASKEEDRITDELISFKKSGRSKNLSDEEKQMVHTIALSHLQKTVSHNMSYPKDVTIKIRLQNELYEDLYSDPDEWIGSQFGISQSQYIKAIVEYYARNTFYRREGIFFKELINLIQNNNNACLLRITLQNGRSYIVKPYRLSYEYEADYHYLIGLAKSSSDQENYQPASWRLARIKDIKLRSTGSAKITQKEQKQLEKIIKDNGVNYILGKTTEFVIRLTSTGMDMYNTIFHSRPQYDSLKPNGDGTFTMMITASERQITNYFFTFGKEAQIVSPESTRDWVIKRYKESIEGYKG